MPDALPSDVRAVRLFRNGRSQAVRIPVDFELPGKDATIRREGDRLIIEPVKPKMNLLELLASWDPIDEEFPPRDEGLLPPREIDL